MPEGNGQPTETSALLPKNQPQVNPVDPGDGIAPDAPLANGVVGNGTVEGDGGDLERQTSAADRQKQYEGIPDGEKKMRFIFPAVAIGIFLSAADQTIIVSSYGKIGSELKALNNTSWIATA